MLGYLGVGVDGKVEGRERGGGVGMESKGKGRTGGRKGRILATIFLFFVRDARQHKPTYPSLPPSLPPSLQVALDFHRLRDRAPYLFLSPALNKFYYALMGLRDFFVRSCKNLPEKVELWCDGKQVVLPPQTESFIVLNINSHAGGVELWPEYSMGGGMEGWVGREGGREGGREEGREGGREKATTLWRDLAWVLQKPSRSSTPSIVRSLRRRHLILL